MYELLCCRLLWDSFWCRNTHLTEPSRLLFTAVWRLFFFLFSGSWGNLSFRWCLSINVWSLCIWPERPHGLIWASELWSLHRREVTKTESQRERTQCSAVSVCAVSHWYLWGVFCALFFLIYFCFYQSSSLNSGEESHGHPKMWRSLNLLVLLPLRTKARPAY